MMMSHCELKHLMAYGRLHVARRCSNDTHARNFLITGLVGPTKPNALRYKVPRLKLQCRKAL